MKQILLPFLLLLILFPIDIFCAEERDQEPSYWDEIKKKFEEAKSDNKELSEKATEWIEKDIRKIGDWEYKVVSIKFESAGELEMKLNELGNERWECFWIEKRGEEMLFLFKKPKISYMQKIPRGELFKLMPEGN